MNLVWVLIELKMPMKHPRSNVHGSGAQRERLIWKLKSRSHSQPSSQVPQILEFNQLWIQIS